MNRVIQRTITITIVERWCFFWPEAPTTALPMDERAAATDAPLAAANTPTAGQRFRVLEVCRIVSSSVQTVSTTAAALPLIVAQELEAQELSTKEVD